MIWYFAIALVLFALFRALGATPLDAAITACAWPLLLVLSAIISGIMLLELLDQRFSIR